MAYLGVCIWLVCAVLAYGVGKLVVLCCDQCEWDRPHRILIGVGSLLLGPVALLLALKTLIWVEMAKDASHRFTLHCKR